MAQKLQKLNMGNILKQVGYITGQSRKITYYRPPIYERDDYGIDTSVVNTNEILIPNVQAYMRNIKEKDYVLQRGGHNIIGTSRVYLPNLTTLKNFPNFNQSNNILFNEIEGYDKLIDVDRVVYTIPTSGTGDWETNGGTLTSDGESIFVALTGVGRVDYVAPTARNTLEANRFTFQVRADTGDSVQFNSANLSHGGITAAYTTDFNNTNFVLLDDNWLTVDVPFASGTLTHPASTSSIYQDGTRYNVKITSGATFDYKDDFYKFRFEYTNGDNPARGTVLQFRNMRYYKGIDWVVHSVNDYNDEFMVFDCVRIAGKRESRRRAY